MMLIDSFQDGFSSLSAGFSVSWFYHITKRKKSKQKIADKRKLSDAWTEDKYWKKSPAAARSGRLQRTQEILDGKEDLHDALLPFTAVNLAPR